AAPGSSSSSGGALQPFYCGSSAVASYNLPAPGSHLSLVPDSAVNLGNLSSFTCGGGPCEFYTAQNGMRGAYNSVAPAFTNFELEDTFKPNEKLNFNAGIRYDDF